MLLQSSSNQYAIILNNAPIKVIKRDLQVYLQVSFNIKKHIYSNWFDNVELICCKSKNLYVVKARIVDYRENSLYNIRNSKHM